jgi:hypothetical protein
MRCLTSDLVTGIAAVAESKGGSFLSDPIDATETRATLAYVSEGFGFVSALRGFATALEDDLLVKRASVAEPASAAYDAARVSGRTAQGKALKVQLDELKALKPARRAASKRAAVTPPPATPATK